MSVVAIALRPKLLLRARELTGWRADVDAEDLVSLALLAMVAKPPNPKTPAQLHHWLRTVLRNQAARSYRNMHGVEVVSWDALQEAGLRQRAPE
jgi:DNA-directed RNA polymerase specialized sigma24 family protein